MVTLNIKVIDHYGQPLAGVDIVPIEDSEKEYRTDLNGKLVIADINKSEFLETYQIYNLLGFENYKFSFVPNADTALLVILQPQKPKIISERVFVFEMVEVNKERLVLKGPSGQVQEFVRVD